MSWLQHDFPTPAGWNVHFASAALWYGRACLLLQQFFSSAPPVCQGKWSDGNFFVCARRRLKLLFILLCVLNFFFVYFYHFLTSLMWKWPECLWMYCLFDFQALMVGLPAFSFSRKELLTHAGLTRLSARGSGADVVRSPAETGKKEALGVQHLPVFLGNYQHVGTPLHRFTCWHRFSDPPLAFLPQHRRGMCLQPLYLLHLTIWRLGWSGNTTGGLPLVLEIQLQGSSVKGSFYTNHVSVFSLVAIWRKQGNSVICHYL